jgi:hypothetical protein
MGFIIMVNYINWFYYCGFYLDDASQIRLYMHVAKHIWIYRLYSELIYNEHETKYFPGLVALLIQMPCYANHTFPYSGTLTLVTLLCPAHTKRNEDRFDIRMWWVALRPSPCWRNMRLCLRAYFTIFLGVCRRVIAGHNTVLVGWFISVVPTWSIGHPWNASFHFSFLI